MHPLRKYDVVSIFLLFKYSPSFFEVYTAFIIISLSFQVNETVPYFHPAEVGILNQLLDIATDYWTIENFTKQHVNTVFVTGGQKKEELHGMYVQALCSGLESVLEPYRQTLIDLEKSILK